MTLCSRISNEMEKAAGTTQLVEGEIILLESVKQRPRSRGKSLNCVRMCVRVSNYNTVYPRTSNDFNDENNEFDDGEEGVKDLLVTLAISQKNAFTGNDWRYLPGGCVGLERDQFLNLISNGRFVNLVGKHSELADDDDVEVERT